jgi:Leucine Rich repeat
MQEVLEQAEPQYRDEDNLSDVTKLCCPYIHKLMVSQLQVWRPPLTWDKEDIPEIYPIDHINFEPILKELTDIEELDVIFGMNKVADTFAWNMFKLTVDDCQHLGQAVLYLEKLTVLKIHRSQIGDLHAQALMQGLINNKTLMELNLGHCQIDDHGALCIAKVMTVHPTLQKLILTDNRIGGVGGEGLGFALLHETCCPLVRLDLRLNNLGHTGTMGILRALVRGDRPRELNLAACGFEDETSIRVGQMINLNKSLQKLDVSNNWFGEAGGEVNSIEII